MIDILTLIEILALVLLVPFSIWLIHKALADPTDGGIQTKVHGRVLGPVGVVTLFLVIAYVIID